MGPTFDDMTNNGIAIGLGKELILNNQAYRSIEESYNKLNKIGRLKLKGMTKAREKMAFLPQGSIPLTNNIGTAPGVLIKEKNTNIFILPGVPTEMKAMFKNSILPLLKENKRIFIQKGFIFTEIGESQIAPLINELKDNYPNLWIKTHPKSGPSIEIELSITCFDNPNCHEKVDVVLNKLKHIILDLGGQIK